LALTAGELQMISISTALDVLKAFLLGLKNLLQRPDEDELHISIPRQ
jgi:hypothetical protein